MTSCLLTSRCVPCEGGIPPLTKEEVETLLREVPGWAASENQKIWREFTFKNFRAALAFVNKAAELAERERHHPDILIHNYRKVRIELSTHAIDGLSQNDFIMAAKINAISLPVKRQTSND